jgi:Mn2+/Fe2+ NRAMP family transporter
VNRSAVSGIVVTTVMRFILFLSALGVVSGGALLDQHNPAASVFNTAAGEIGYKFFGVVMWCAAITSVIGASFTSISFMKTFSPVISKNEKWVISLFILLCTIIFVFLKQAPSSILVTAGLLNGFILPLALAILLLAVTRKSLFPNYKHPLVLQIIGWIVVAIMTWLSIG